MSKFTDLKLRAEKQDWTLIHTGYGRYIATKGPVPVEFMSFKSRDSVEQWITRIEAESRGT